MSVGQTVQIEMGDKTIKKFEVIDKKTVSEAQASQALFEKKAAIKAQLNIITCGGKFDRNSQSYPDRVIIYSKLVD